MVLQSNFVHFELKSSRRFCYNNKKNRKRKQLILRCIALNAAKIQYFPALCIKHIIFGHKHSRFSFPSLFFHLI